MSAGDGILFSGDPTGNGYDKSSSCRFTNLNKDSSISFISFCLNFTFTKFVFSPIKDVPVKLFVDKSILLRDSKFFKSESD